MKPVLKEWFVDAPWGKIALISWGSPRGQRVLLVHGRQDSSATFEPLLALLPDQHYYVGVDLPGHGKSDPFPVGLFYNAAFPNIIKKFIHLDIGLALYSISQKPFKNFYETYENYYDNYNKTNIDDRVYTKMRAVESVQHARGLSAELAAHVLSRNLRRLPRVAPPGETPDEPPDEDLAQYRLSWDKRLKHLTHLNLPYEQMLYLFTTDIPPSLFIATTDSIKIYQNLSADRLIQEMEKRVKTFEYRVVEGSHDVHLTNPERIADDIIAFLNTEKVKSKL